MEMLLNFFGSTGFPFVIIGDVIIDCSANSSQGDDFRNIIASYGCSNQITVVTRITANNASSLDIYTSNLSDTDVMTGIFLCDISDHFLIFLIDFIGGKKNVIKIFCYRKLEEGSLY